MCQDCSTELINIVDTSVTVRQHRAFADVVFIHVRIMAYKIGETKQ